MKDIILILLLIALVVCIIGLLFLVVLECKSKNTFKNRMKILDAVYDYQVASYESGMDTKDFKVRFNDLEDDNKTFWRLWDWGYTRILSKDKFEIIKSYIK